MEHKRPDSRISASSLSRNHPGSMSSSPAIAAVKPSPSAGRPSAIKIAVRILPVLTGLIFLSNCLPGSGNEDTRVRHSGGSAQITKTAERRNSPWQLISVPKLNMTSISCGIYDEVRNCIWFGQDFKICKYDLKTGEARLITDGRDKGGIGAYCMALEGDHLWVGGHAAYGGGLWMYDIPSDSAVVYREENTQEGGRKGIPNNSIWRIFAEKGLVWISSDNWIYRWGLVRLAYKETEHARRWTNWTVQSTNKDYTNKNGLISDNITNVLPAQGGGYWLFYEGSGPEGYVYQHFDPSGPSFKTYRLMPQGRLGTPAEADTVEAVSTRGAKGKIWRDQNNQRYSFIALRDGEIWFKAGLTSYAPWGHPLGFAAILCFNPSTNTYTIYGQGASESRPAANDGMFDQPGSLCFDGREIWVAHSGLSRQGISRYNRDTREFTYYTRDLSGLPLTNTLTALFSTKDYVFFASNAGLLRYEKSGLWPKMVDSNPAEGAQDITVEKELTVTFDMPLRASTVHSNSVELWVNGALFGGNVSYDETRRAVVFSIPKRLPSGMDCKLVCKSLIQVENGNPIRWTEIKFHTK
jgi:hypothetical protein